ncbi:acyclic terpene utilization AtuA family protein [Salsuginibacillus kocurii]|uniref:acyclic terpene utilization AtuA family protein n=1 Tax=Salsuginibacillus kocurii TaxID=427078 RepID=UPI00036B860E|nr:acyclic terpene utilization AtuA family protein [Salsuginibacillus kocurii]
MLKIGSGAGFSGDRIDPAVELAREVDLDYLVLECLAERTIAKAQKEKKQNSTRGYDPFLIRRIKPLLTLIDKKRFTLISNMGAANPSAAGTALIEMAASFNISLKVAVVTGDDVLQLVSGEELVLETNEKLQHYTPFISANAYLGIDSMLPAFEFDPDIIITGRVADPSLFLAPMVYHYGWDQRNCDLLGQGTLIGHLLECAGQITGGYFADPGIKDVPNLAELGFPFAIIEEDGTAIITKPENSGGIINEHTVKEQLLYEVHDPSSYITPDVTADFSKVEIKEIAENKVQIKGGAGKQKSANYKVSIGYFAGHTGEGEISYAGASAYERAQLAGEIVKKRLAAHQVYPQIEMAGVDTLHGVALTVSHPYEVRLRVAARCDTKEQADLVGEEVEALYTNGPFGGGGARKFTHECVGILSTLLSRKDVDTRVQVEVHSIEK